MAYTIFFLSFRLAKKKKKNNFVGFPTSKHANIFVDLKIIDFQDLADTLEVIDLVLC